LLTPNVVRARTAPSGEYTLDPRATTAAADGAPAAEAVAGDLAALRKMIGEARVVGLGEASQGSRELVQTKIRILEMLARQAGFTLVAIAADPPEAARLNAYLHIAADNTVTLFSPKTEMGQGVHTTLALLVAEELEVEWDKMRVETAPTSPDFPNMGTGGSRSAGTTTRAPMFQRPAGRTQLGRVPGVQSDNRPTSLCRFVGQDR